MAYRFHHLHIICKDLEKMITFFTENLGANLVRRKKFGTADGASLDLQGTTVNLRVSREDDEMVGDASQSRYGYDHIGLEVEDIDSAFKDLQAQGFSFPVPPTDIPNLRIAFFKGAEDITIELVQPLS
ncbi:MAG: VOC family protein [Desulfobacterales bacterium]|jgi:catechol 2,3-dioxygenase-like lactoylglutathione lyase family enzyme